MLVFSTGINAGQSHTDFIIFIEEKAKLDQRIFCDPVSSFRHTKQQVFLCFAQQNSIVIVKPWDYGL